MIFLSFDIASRSLAFTIMKYNVDFLENISKLSLEENNIHNFLNILEYINNNIQLRIIDVVDLNQGKRNSEILPLEKTKKLKEVLNTLTIVLNEFSYNSGEEVRVLLEYQMPANYQANAVFNQIFYHFSEYAPVIISPCYKNRIYFSKDLEYKNFSSKYAKSYSANKAHTKANFIYFIESFSNISSIKHIKKKNLDDAADSFMQIFAYINYYLKKS
jgi:hypothetical protein